MSTEIELFRQQAILMERMETKISKMEEQVNTMAIAVARIDERFKTLPANAEKLKHLETRIVVQETKGRIWGSVFGAVAGAVTALVVGLLIRYFTS